MIYDQEWIHLGFSVLRESGRVPRLHGNRFLQFDLVPDGSIRLHVWHPELPEAQKVYTPIHDHAFDMQSKILYGTLVNTHYGITDARKSKDYALWEATQATRVPGKNHNTILGNTGRVTRLGITAQQRLRAGSEYSLEAFRYHTSEALYPHEEAVMTIMHKQASHPGKPVIAVPVGEAPDNEFDRHGVDVDRLWWCMNDAIELWQCSQWERG